MTNVPKLEKYLHICYSRSLFVFKFDFFLYVFFWFRQDTERTVLYSNMLSFGGYGDRLAIVSDGDRGVDKFLYSLSAEKVSLLLLLLADLANGG